MATIVQKFGGTSVADADRIRNVARRVVATAETGHRVAVVVSAMAGETDRLVALAHELGGEEPDSREYDVLVSTGEQKTIALLAMAIQGMGRRASMTRCSWPAATGSVGSGMPKRGSVPAWMISTGRTVTITRRGVSSPHPRRNGPCT